MSQILKSKAKCPKKYTKITFVWEVFTAEKFVVKMRKNFEIRLVKSSNSENFTYFQRAMRGSLSASPCFDFFPRAFFWETAAILQENNKGGKSMTEALSTY